MSMIFKIVPIHAQNKKLSSLYNSRNEVKDLKKCTYRSKLKIKNYQVYLILEMIPRILINAYTVESSK